jgi:hypothetical protein
MNFAKKLVVVFGAVALAAIIGTILTPKVAQAVATLVQVANDAAHPVPVANPPSVLVSNLNADLPPGLVVDDGPLDVSNYASIRFYGDPAGPTQAQITFTLFAVDPNGNLFVLDRLSATSNAGEPAFVTGAYPTPGTSLKVRVLVSCLPSAPCPSTQHVNFAIYGH